MTVIRQETLQDIAAVRRVNELAFDGPAEAVLVDRLRENGQATISLVAVENDQVVGHILFSPVTAESDPTRRLVGLAPMAVLPELQNKGIGSRLARAGLDRCRESGFAGVIVLGHAKYYPRFGFVPASRFGIRGEYDVPDDVFMALELGENTLAGVSGLVRYRPEFKDV